LGRICYSLFIVSRVTEHPDFSFVSEGHEVGDELSAFRNGGLSLWILVRELDTVLVIAARENLDFA
jgi:hypothetical protein